MTCAYNPAGAWTNQHQMSINSKRDDFTVADLRQYAPVAGLNPRRLPAIVDQVTRAVEEWPSLAGAVGVTAAWIPQIAMTHRLILPKA